MKRHICCKDRQTSNVIRRLKVFVWIICLGCFAVTAPGQTESESPVILSIRADKIRVKLQEQQDFAVTICNNTKEDLIVKLRAWINHGVDQRISLPDKTEQIDAGMTKELTFAWTPEKELWGCRINAELTAGDKKYSAYDVFFRYLSEEHLGRITDIKMYQLYSYEQRQAAIA